MFWQRMPFEQQTFCVRRKATAWLRRIVGCVCSQSAPPILPRLLLSAICIVLTVAPAEAGFCISTGSISAHPFPGSLENSGTSNYAVLSLTAPSFQGVWQKLGDSGVSHSAATKPSPWKSPAPPVDQPVPPESLILGDFAADFSGRTLSGSAKSLSGGATSAAGIFETICELRIPLLSYWQRGRESLFIPAGPEPEIFHPS